MTLVIAGNHEYYGRTVVATNKLIEDICSKHDRLCFLNESSFHAPNSQITFLGATLWSDIDTRYAGNIRQTLSDFHHINGWGMSEAKEAFYSSFTWLRTELDLQDDNGKKFVILTHHCPIVGVGNPIHSGSYLSSAFETDLSKFIEDNTDRIVYWFYGHNHYSNDTLVGKTRVISNQVGYKDFDEICKYNPDLQLIV